MTEEEKCRNREIKPPPQIKRLSRSQTNKRSKKARRRFNKPKVMVNKLQPGFTRDSTHYHMSSLVSQYC